MHGYNKVIISLAKHCRRLSGSPGPLGLRLGEFLFKPVSDDFVARCQRVEKGLNRLLASRAKLYPIRQDRRKKKVKMSHTRDRRRVSGFLVFVREGAL